jgi:hypothetical protein
MGESRRRKQVGDYPTISLSVPQEIKDDICKALRSFTLIEMGGSCLSYALLANATIKALGLPIRVTWGGMLYQIGEDEKRDCISFAKRFNRGGIVPGYGFVAHAWNRIGGDLLDFTDWKQMVVNMRMGLDVQDHPFCADELALGDPVFAVEPPYYIWQPAKPLMDAWRPFGTPRLGEFWYGPYDALDDHPNLNDAMLNMKLKLPVTERAVKELRLVERIKEWRSMS